MMVTEKVSCRAGEDHRYNRGVLPEGFAHTVNTNLLFFQTENLKEGLDAFFAKRRPSFKGRQITINPAIICSNIDINVL